MNKNLDLARSLKLPTREMTLQREHSVHEFWLNNKTLLKNAWLEWEKAENINPLSNSLLDKHLTKTVQQAWNNPEKEIEVRELIEKVSPGVYQFQFFDPEKLQELRNYLKKIEESNIPVRSPYGIVLNRKGAMLDQRSEGYLAAPVFQDFYKNLIDIYMRPISRLLFPEIMGFDTQPFGFSIQYQVGMDTSIRMHTDASSVTLNINLNLPEEKFTGSEVDFIDPVTHNRNRVTFKPGVAVLHRGNIAHEAQHITSGERTNFIFWLFGDQMQIPRFENVEEKYTPKTRWTVPNEPYDQFAPF